MYVKLFNYTIVIPTAAATFIYVAFLRDKFAAQSAKPSTEVKGVTTVRNKTMSLAVLQDALAKLGPGLEPSSIVIRAYNVAADEDTTIIKWVVKVGTDEKSALTLQPDEKASDAAAA